MKPLEAGNLGDILRLPAHPNHAAYIDLLDAENPRTFSALEFDRLAAAVGLGLSMRGVCVGERIAILSANRVEFLACYLGIMRMGAVAVPINFKLPAEVIAHIFLDSGIGLAFVDAARAPLTPAGAALIDFDDEGRTGFGGLLAYGHWTPFVPSHSDLAEILYTSGSTGVPKGVPLTHHGQMWALRHYTVEITAETPKDITLIVAPLYHMNGLFASLNALANRVTVVSLPSFDAVGFLKTVSEYRITIVTGIPTMFALMVRERHLAADVDLLGVREVRIGSAPLTDALLEQVGSLFPNARVTNGFGTTEVGPAVFGPHPAGIATPALSVGFPIPGISWALLDGATRDEGVLALKTPALTAGYLNQPGITADKMRDGWYVTGDILRRNADGFFFFVGRADDMFVCGGENVYPGEVEKLLERHPGVDQAVVVPAPDDIKGQIPVAFVVTRDPSVSPEAIKQYALKHGPAYAHPRFVLLRDALPVSGTHKIDRTALTTEAAQLSRAHGRARAQEI